MSRANPLWGAPCLDGELLKLSIVVAQSTVAKYLLRRRKPPSQTWRTFLTNHVEQIASMDFFTVPHTRLAEDRSRIEGARSLPMGLWRLRILGRVLNPVERTSDRLLPHSVGLFTDPFFHVRPPDVI